MKGIACTQLLGLRAKPSSLLQGRRGSLICTGSHCKKKKQTKTPEMPEVMRNAAASVLGGHLSSSTAQCCVLPAGGWRKPSGDGALRGEPAPHQCHQPCKGQKSVSNHRGLSAKRLETSQSEVDVLGCPRSPLGLHAS